MWSSGWLSNGLITEELAELVRRAVNEALPDTDGIGAPKFERPKHRDHGDWSTNIALVAAKGRGAPRDIALKIKDCLPQSELIEKVDVAGPGFLNFYLAPQWLHQVVRSAADPESHFGKAPAASRSHVNVEYVSANPTGPVNVVSGRHAAVGDAIANILEAAGHRVTREFYINDAGRQIDLFGASIGVRYLQHFGHEASLPEDGYQGEYLKDIAASVAAEVGDRFLEADSDTRDRAMRAAGLEQMLAQMRDTLERFGTKYDVWFSEQSLHDRGLVAEAVAKLETAGYIEERDGAKWFLTTKFGDDKDRVVIRSNGESTYLASDLPYLIDKFSRGFDHLIYLWGADHHGTIKRLLAGAEALGLDPAKVEVRLVQIVSLLSGGEAVKASKRAGAIVPLDELVDDVGVDAARYTFLSRSYDGPLEFDLVLAKEQAPENPVYYVQYAHARICSILRKAAEQGLHPDAASAPLELAIHPSEDQLVRKLANYEEVIPEAAEMRAPQRIARYIEELASDFSSFYRDCKVVGEDEGVTSARLALCVATKNVLASALALLGVSAPEKM